MALEQWLVEEALVTAEQLQQAAIRQEEAGLTLQMALLELQLLDEASLVDLIARRNKLPKAPGPLHRIKVSPRAVSSIPQDLCWQNAIFPFGIDRGSKRLQLAVVDPANLDLNSLGSLAEYSIDLFIIGPKQLEKAIRKHYLDSMVDDTGAVRKRRFFGYDEITDPGLSPTLSSVSPPRKERPTPPPLDALPHTGRDLAADEVSSSAKTPTGSGEIPLPPSGEIPLPEPALDQASATERVPLEPRQGHLSPPAQPEGPLCRTPTPVIDLTSVPLQRTLTPVSVDGDESADPVQQRSIGAIPTVPRQVTTEQLADHNRRTRPSSIDPVQLLTTRIQVLEHAVIQLADLIASSDLPEQMRERAHQIISRLRSDGGS